MKTYTLLLIATFATIISVAQNRWQQGFIITLNDEKIQGELLLQNSKKASNYCIYRKDENTDNKTYTSSEIKAYGFANGKYYTNKVLNNKFVFMECLIEGHASIYFLADENGDHYFIETAQSGLVELSEPKDIIVSDNRTYEKPSQHRGKLKIILNTPQINDKIDKTELKSKSLVDLITLYEQTINSDTTSYTVYFGLSKPIIKKGVFLTFSKNHYDFGKQLATKYGTGIEAGYTLDIRNISSSNPNISISLNFLMGYEHNQTVVKSKRGDYFYNEPVSFNGVPYIINPKPYFNTVPELDVEMHLLSVQLPVMLNYYRYMKTNALSIGLGISNKFVLYQNKKFIHNFFQQYYGKTVTSPLFGGIFKLGYEHKIKNYVLFSNAVIDYLYYPKVEPTLRLSHNKIALQVGYMW